jgi:dihydrofolate reductase
VAVIVYYIASSVDGFIATLEGGISWLAPFEGRAEDYGYADFYKSVDAVIVGGRTYEACLKFGEWPFPGKPCWVFSRQKREVKQPDVIITDQPPREVVAELGRRGVKRAWLVGGGELAGSFRESGLIDEYIISYIPTILGDGIPLFGFSSVTEKLELIGSKSYPVGIVQAHYRHATDRPGS